MFFDSKYTGKEFYLKIKNMSSIGGTIGFLLFVGFAVWLAYEIGKKKGK